MGRLRWWLTADVRYVWLRVRKAFRQAPPAPAVIGPRDYGDIPSAVFRKFEQIRLALEAGNLQMAERLRRQLTASGWDAPETVEDCAILREHYEKVKYQVVD